MNQIHIIALLSLVGLCKSEEDLCKCNDVDWSGTSYPGYPTDGRVYNGTDADGKSLEYVASIFRFEENSWGFLPFRDRFKVFHRCSGVILNPKFILTAEHCFNLEGDENITFYAASGGDFMFADFFQDGRNPGLRQIKASYRFDETASRETNPFNLPYYAPIAHNLTHPSKNLLNDSINDIMLVELVEPFEFGKRTNQYPACLYTSDHNKADYKVPGNLIIAGYGSEAKKGEEPVRQNRYKILRWTPVKLFAFILKPNPRIMITGPSSTCPGDSGSTLLYRESGKLFTFAIGSRGPKCAEGLSNTYVLIYPYLGWIHSYLKTYEGPAPQVCADMESWYEDVKKLKPSMKKVDGISSTKDTVHFPKLSTGKLAEIPETKTRVFFILITFGLAFCALVAILYLRWKRNIKFKP